MITSYSRGHEIYYSEGKWLYVDDQTSAAIDRPCARCGRMPTADGHDACLGHVDGVTSACCGHGVEIGYQIKGRQG